mgnify:FL=1
MPFVPPGATPTLFQSMQPGMSLGEGVYTVSAMATDQNGLTSSCSFTLTVKGILDVYLLICNIVHLYAI